MVSFLLTTFGLMAQILTDCTSEVGATHPGRCGADGEVRMFDTRYRSRKLKGGACRMTPRHVPEAELSTHVGCLANSKN
jgi:hypothetical protein